MGCRAACKVDATVPVSLPSSPSSLLFIRRMASLAPPSFNRHRASSTSLRPPLTLNSLGRRRSNSDLAPLTSPANTPNMSKDVPSLSLDIPSSASTHKLLAKATFIELYSRFMDLIHAANRESPYSSTPSSPRHSRTSLSTEDSLLPISSPTVGTFSEAYSEKPAAKSTSWWQGAPSVRRQPFCRVSSALTVRISQVHTPVFFVVALFPLSTALLLFCMSTLPITTTWPRNLTDLAQLGRELHGYSQSGVAPMAHVISVLSVVVAWNHAWSIPGSVLWVRFYESIQNLCNELTCRLPECPGGRAFLTSSRDHPSYRSHDGGINLR